MSSQQIYTDFEGWEYRRKEERTPKQKFNLANLDKFAQTKVLNDEDLEYDIIPLALPRGKVLKCEVCNVSRCRYHCHGCKAVFYCGTEHRAEHYVSIHRHICSRVDFVRMSRNPSCVGDRGRESEQQFLIKKEICDIAIQLASESLRKCRTKDAFYQLNDALKYMIELEGSSSFKLVPIYSYFIEAYINKGEISQAETILKKAKLILLEDAENCTHRDMADFHMNEGKFHIAAGNLHDAIECFANEVFYATEAYHPEHPRTGTGLFHLGKVFHTRGLTRVAVSHFLHAVEIYLIRLTEVTKEYVDVGKRLVNLADISDINLDFNHCIEKYISVDEMQNACEILNFIAQHTEENEKVKAEYLTQVTACKVICASGLAKFFGESFKQAGELAMRCKLMLHNFKDPRLSDQVQFLYKAVNKAMKKKNFKQTCKSIRNVAKMRHSLKCDHNQLALERHVDTARERRQKLEEDKYKRAITASVLQKRDTNHSKEPTTTY